MYYMLSNDWYCQFLEADLKTPLPRKFRFSTSDKVVELAERGERSERSREQASA
jgi:hypothetical protein